MDTTESNNSELDALLSACKEIDRQPPPLSDLQAQSFLADFPLDRIFRALSAAQDSRDVDLVTDALRRVLGTELGTSLLPGAAPYLEAAAAAPLPALRLLAAEQYGRLLLHQALAHELPYTALTAAAANDSGGAAVPYGNGGTDDAYGADAAEAVTLTCLALVRCLSDPDTRVAEAAAAALRSYGGTGLAAVRGLLRPGCATAEALGAAAEGDAGGVVRLRVVALALQLAAGGGGGPASYANGVSTADSEDQERLALVRGSGLLGPLLRQLADPRDALACLAALQTLEDVMAGKGRAGSGGGGGGRDEPAGALRVAAALAALVLPQLLALVADPLLSDAAVPLVAGIVRRSLPEDLRAEEVAAAMATEIHDTVAVANGGAGAMDVDGAGGDRAGEQTALGRLSLEGSEQAGTAAPGLLAAAPALLAAVRGVLDEAGCAGPGSEACGLDAVGRLAASRAGAQLVAADAALVRSVLERALGRSPHPEVRSAALHAAASLAGLERAGRGREREAARLPDRGEEALRLAVFGACGARRPGEVLLGLLQQPFAPTRIAAYRLTAALSLRAWFAAEAATCPPLLARLTDPAAEAGGGAAPAQWRHAALAALGATLAAAATGEGRFGEVGGEGEGAYRGTLCAPELVEAVRRAVAGGPYGGGAGGALGAAEAARLHGQHWVATRGGAGGA